jgi:hypothetical protein
MRQQNQFKPKVNELLKHIVFWFKVFKILLLPILRASYLNSWSRVRQFEEEVLPHGIKTDFCERLRQKDLELQASLGGLHGETLSLKKKRLDFIGTI